MHNRRAIKKPPDVTKPQLRSTVQIVLHLYALYLTYIIYVYKDRLPYMYILLCAVHVYKYIIRIYIV